MIKVLKFGGTSVGSATNMRQVAEVIMGEGSNITVLSAMSGTTDALVKISALATNNQKDEIPAVVDMLRQKYSTCISELLKDGSAAMQKLEQTLSIIEAQVSDYKESYSDRVILSQGELLTSAIFTMYLCEMGVKTELLNAPSFMHMDSESRVDVKALEVSLAGLDMSGQTKYVTQGFIATNCQDEIDNLGRGGSDYSAALIGAAVKANEVQIWTDIDGMHNNDPRYVEGTYPIRNISFDEAAELAYFGAKILHPATIQPCKDLNIPVYLKNTMDPKAEGTCISFVENQEQDFHAVAAKDGITVIRIYSARMLMAYGFLRKVFEIFEQHKTPIDMITTSEVAVSLTVDNDTHVDEIVEELKALGKVEIERDNTIVCIVGRLDHDRVGLASKVFESLNDISVKMISYGASHRSLALLISKEHKIETLRSLNKHLF
ncbi:MAG: aspartate kinase [Rikenellaceae bacterium]